MIRHVVMFRWNDQATPERVAAASEGLRRLPSVIAEIARYEYGPDLALAEGNADFVVVADFADTESYLTYRDHPAHQSLIAELLAPLIAARTALQYRI